MKKQELVERCVELFAKVNQVEGSLMERSVEFYKSQSKEFLEEELTFLKSVTI